MKTGSILIAMIISMISAGAAWADVPRPEHPRPDFERDNWQNLNGEWDFSFDPGDRGLSESWHERDSLPDKITVPFPVESELSGVAEKRPPEVMWYLRRFDLDPSLEWPGKTPGRLYVNFGAVDYEATVWLNGEKLGGHIGGYTPFSFDISGSVKPAGNVLALRVKDSLDRMQVRGKQSPTGKPYLIMYTTVSGVWQTVYLERRGDPHIKNYRFVPNEDLSGGVFELDTSGYTDEVRPVLEIIAPDGCRERICDVTWTGMKARWKTELTEPWSPDNPTLYRVNLSLVSKSGRTVDEVRGYVGMRSIKVEGNQVLLNGEPFYQKLLLDQGYFPGGIYTPKDDEAMRADVETYKLMGFNGLRKHQKIEDPRFLYWCDKLGLVVWEEMPSLGFGVPRGVPEKMMGRFDQEWMEAIGRDYNHPCIIAWTVFNENWGIAHSLFGGRSEKWARDAVKRTRRADPTRLIVDNSGSWHFDSDIWDFHHYLSTAEKSRDLYEKYDFKKGDHVGLGWYFLKLLSGDALIPVFMPGEDYGGQPIIVSEYGGFGFYPTKGQDLLTQYRDYTLMMKNFPQIKGYCYTQPYDVEQEKNGLMTFDRRPKVPIEEIKAINDQMGH